MVPIRSRFAATPALNRFPLTEGLPAQPSVVDGLKKSDVSKLRQDVLGIASNAMHICVLRMGFTLTAPHRDGTDGRSSALKRESMPRTSIGDSSLYYERHG